MALIREGGRLVDGRVVEAQAGFTDGLVQRQNALLLSTDSLSHLPYTRALLSTLPTCAALHSFGAFFALSSFVLLRTLRTPRTPSSRPQKRLCNSFCSTFRIGVSSQTSLNQHVYLRSVKAS